MSEVTQDFGKVMTHMAESRDSSCRSHRTYRDQATQPASTTYQTPTSARKTQARTCSRIRIPGHRSRYGRDRDTADAISPLFQPSPPETPRRWRRLHPHLRPPSPRPSTPHSIDQVTILSITAAAYVGAGAADHESPGAAHVPRPWSKIHRCGTKRLGVESCWAVSYRAAPS